jgi:hypothetical protein
VLKTVGVDCLLSRRTSNCGKGLREEDSKTRQISCVRLYANIHQAHQEWMTTEVTETVVTLVSSITWESSSWILTFDSTKPAFSFGGGTQVLRDCQRMTEWQLK